MKLKSKILSVITSCAVAVSAAVAITATPVSFAAGTTDISDTYSWDAVRIGGGGFVSGIVTGKETMYARTDVGGAYKFNYETDCWDQLFADLDETERGYLSIDAMCIDPTNEDIAYFLCGCAYFSDAGTRIYKTTDGGKTFTYTDVTDLIQVHANGGGRQTGESIAIDPDNPDVIYCGGDVTAGESALIKSTDGGETWAPVKGYDDLGLFATEIKWPMWTTHMARAIDDSEYTMQNGVATIMIEDGKVYVGTSTTGEYNMVVADVDKDEFTSLPIDTAHFPARITSDGQGNIYFAYQGALIVGNGGAAGGIYKYNTATGESKDISPKTGGFSGVGIDRTNPDRLVTSTCGLWSAQLWQAWTEEQGPAWGDLFFKSEDGGETWTEMTPGKEAGWNQPLVSEYLDDNGYAWIRDKAIHWVGAIVVDPKNPDRIHTTSGNGMFSCDNTWADVPQFYFHPDGVEEVVALDMTSVPGGDVYSAIGDYDGFVHKDVKEIPLQHQPNMGSTSAIAYCPQNPDVMVRIAENDGCAASGYYTLDGGATWTKLSCSYGGKAAITQLDEGTYRIFQSAKSDSTTVSYSDDFGATWNTCSGIPSSYGSKPTNMYVDPEDPSLVYAYVTYFNSSWHYSKPEPDMSDAKYVLCVSTDYGATFTSTDICLYDQCDSAGRIAALGDGTIILGAGWNGMYKATNAGKTIEKIDTVSYCKTVGYGAPEKEGSVNTLYIYGKPLDTDPEGIYRSTDSGETWVCINTSKLYGGTGNGNFLVGDMNEFGKVYMSTVGCGIIYGTAGATVEPKPTEPTEETTEAPTSDVTEATTTEATVEPTEETTETPTSNPSTDITLPSYTGDTESLIYGDVDLNGAVELGDTVTLAKYIANPQINSLGKGDDESMAKAMEQANVEYDDTINSSDLSKLVEYNVRSILIEELGPQE